MSGNRWGFLTVAVSCAAPNQHFRMPNLGLKGPEIDALVAFINDRGTSTTSARRQ